MPAVTVRNLPEETHRALKLRAAKHGRSTEAEIREILEEAIRPKERISTSTYNATKHPLNRQSLNDHTRYKRRF
jgi:plasmid stability protein